MCDDKQHNSDPPPQHRMKIFSIFLFVYLESWKTATDMLQIKRRLNMAGKKISNLKVVVPTTGLRRSGRTIFPVVRYGQQPITNYTIRTPAHIPSPSFSYLAGHQHRRSLRVQIANALGNQAIILESINLIRSSTAPLNAQPIGPLNAQPIAPIATPQPIDAKCGAILSSLMSGKKIIHFVMSDKKVELFSTSR